MSTINHYIDFLDGLGYIEVRPPQEWKDLNIELSFDNGEQKLSSGSFKWTSSDQGSTSISVASNLNTHVNDGLTGGVGIFEGVPYKATITCDGTTYTIVESCIDLTLADFSCDIVSAPIRETGNIDFLTDRADSFRFEYLSTLPSGAPGRITSTDYIDIWYQAGRYPQKVEIMIAGITLFVTLKETYEVIKRIADVISQALAIPTGALVTAVQIIFLVTYLALLIIALINLIQRLIDLIFPFVYYHRAMYARTLFERGCAYLGLNFSSSIFASTSPVYNMYLMPPKTSDGTTTYNGKKVGQPSTEKGFYEGTFGQFLRDMIEMFNGKIKIAGNTLYFEVEQTFIDQSTFRIPEVKYDFFGYNASEVPATYTVGYQYDSIDLFNYDRPDGMNFQVTVQPTTVVNKQNILLKNLVERSIPFRLPYVKTTVGELEVTMQSVFNGIASVINAISSLIPGNSNTIPSIPLSIGCLQLDTHFTGITMAGIYAFNGKTSANTSNIIGADILFTNYHYYNCPKPIGSYANGNQWLKFKGYKIPFCCEDYLLLKDLNYATYQGNDARIRTLKWNPYMQTADIEFEVNQKYTSNLTATTYISGTQISGTI